MKLRCLNPKTKGFDCYGGRGIKVCDRWLNSFENFLADMGLKPSSEHSIERIDNMGDYTPDNCRWATKKEQARNRRTNRKVTAFGNTLTVAEWSEEKLLSRSCIKVRLDAGWNPEIAVSAPSRKGGCNGLA